MKQDIEIHIEELVLHGFAAVDFDAIRDAVEIELTRLFTEKGVPASLSSPKRYAAINVGQFRASPSGHATIVGNEIAGTVYNGLENHKSELKK